MTSKSRNPKTSTETTTETARKPGTTSATARAQKRTAKTAWRSDQAVKAATETRDEAVRRATVFEEKLTKLEREAQQLKLDNVILRDHVALLEKGDVAKLRASLDEVRKDLRGAQAVIVERDVECAQLKIDRDQLKEQNVKWEEADAEFERMKAVSDKVAEVPTPVQSE